MPRRLEYRKPDPTPDLNRLTSFEFMVDRRSFLDRKSEHAPLGNDPLHIRQICGVHVDGHLRERAPDLGETANVIEVPMRE